MTYNAPGRHRSISSPSGLLMSRPLARPSDTPANSSSSDMSWGAAGPTAGEKVARGRIGHAYTHVSAGHDLTGECFRDLPPPGGEYSGHGEAPGRRRGGEGPAGGARPDGARPRG